MSYILTAVLLGSFAKLPVIYGTGMSLQDINKEQVLVIQDLGESKALVLYCGLDKETIHISDHIFLGKIDPFRPRILWCERIEGNSTIIKEFSRDSSEMKPIITINGPVSHMSISASGWIVYLLYSQTMQIDENILERTSTMGLISPRGTQYFFVNQQPGEDRFALKSDTIVWTSFSTNPNQPPQKTSEIQLFLTKALPEIYPQIITLDLEEQGWRFITQNHSTNLHPDINDNGWIVWTEIEGPYSPYNLKIANARIMLWDGNGRRKREINDQATGWSQPKINNRGEIVWHNPAEGVVYLYREGEILPLGAGRNPVINNNGWVVWTDYYGGTPGKIYIWHETMKKVIDNCQPDSYFINDQNIIVWDNGIDNSEIYIWKP
ncbi:hypothetical protein J7K05_02855 [bacterium]|nr:hypothetical protein [bacterium]